MRLSAFGEAVAPYWPKIDVNSDSLISWEEWADFFGSIEEELGVVPYRNFVIRMVWDADIDVSDLVAELPPAEPRRRWRRRPIPGTYYSGVPTQRNKRLPGYPEIQGFRINRKNSLS